MKLHFDPNQQFQLEAIETIAGVFEGQPLRRGFFDFSLTDDLVHEDGIGTRTELIRLDLIRNRGGRLP